MSERRCLPLFFEKNSFVEVRTYPFSPEGTCWESLKAIFMGWEKETCVWYRLSKTKQRYSINSFLLSATGETVLTLKVLKSFFISCGRRISSLVKGSKQSTIWL